MSFKSWLLGGSGTTDPNKAKFGDADFIRGITQQGITNAQGREAPQSSGNAYTGRLDNVINRLGAISSGQQQGAGELAAQRQGQMALANAIGAANMARGSSAIGSGRAAARAAAGINLQTNGMAQQAAMQDQQAALGQMGGLIGQGGQLDQQQRLANLQARLQTMGLNDQAQLGYLGALGNMNQSELAARMSQEQTNAQNKGLLGGLLNVGGTIGAAYAGRGG